MSDNVQNDARSTELLHRQALWGVVQSSGGELTAQQTRELGIYGGAQGIWVDKSRTSAIDPNGCGVTVGVLHTGEHYADDMSDDGLIYHYPKTSRPKSRDANEVTATKNARVLQLPIFVISHGSNSPGARKIRLGWIEEWDDDGRLFLITFGSSPPIATTCLVDDQPFSIFDGRGRLKKTAQRFTRPEQQRFKFHAVRRYGARCAVCEIGILDVLDAAHLCPKRFGGTDDPRNSLVLCATHHRAMDAGHFAVCPDDLTVRYRSDGPSNRELLITRQDLSHLKNTPHKDALQWIWQSWNQDLAAN